MGEVPSQHFPLLGSHLPPCSLLISFPPTHSGLGDAGQPLQPTSKSLKANGIYMFLLLESKVFKARV